MLDKLRLILYLILIFIGLIALLYIAPIFFIVSIIDDSAESVPCVAL